MGMTVEHSNTRQIHAEVTRVVDAICSPCGKVAKGTADFAQVSWLSAVVRALLSKKTLLQCMSVGRAASSEG